MEKPTKDSENKVSLEELLQLKRAERPDDTFWNQFDSELHQRMMQTLVKKDSWFVQISRAFTGKPTQAAMIGAAAVFAVLVLRPAFVATSDQQSNTASAAVVSLDGSSIEDPDMLEMTTEEFADSRLLGEADYAIEVLTASSARPGDMVTQDFGLDRMEVASYDSEAYSADMAFSGFASTGIASLVY